MHDTLSGFSRPSQLLIKRSLILCKLLLRIQSAFYPFAAINENGRMSCVFADDAEDGLGEMQLIEQLQWQIIDHTTNNHVYAALVYAAHVEINNKQAQDAIVIALCEPDKPERSILYPYYKRNQRVVFAPPLVEK